MKIEEGKPGNATRKPVINEEAAQWDLPMKMQYQSFLAKRKPESTANSYTSCLDHAVREWINKEVDAQADSIFSYTTSEDVRLCIDMLKSSPAFVAENKRKHSSMSAALSQYLLFIEERERRMKL